MGKADVRTGTAADLAAVHGLVRELAIYERAEDQFTASIADYEADFAAGVFEIAVAELNDKIVGMTLFYVAYSTWRGKMLYLEDFVVQEKFRGQGVGLLLYRNFLQIAHEKNCRMVKWQVLDWNTPAIQFYKKNGATIEHEWYNGKIIF